MNILLVDDNEELRDFLALGLREAGLETVAAASSTEALRHVEKTRFDAFVVDSMLGNENGLDLVAQLRASKNGKTTPVLLMSSISTGLARRIAQTAGCSEFLVKPFSQTQFIEQMRGLARGKR